MATLELPGFDEAARFYIAAQRARVLRQYGVALDRGDRTRQRWDHRWASAISSVWPGAAYNARAADAGIAAAGAVWGRVSKAAPNGPDTPPTPPPASPALPIAGAAAIGGTTPPPPDLIPNIESAIAQQIGSSSALVNAVGPVLRSLAADTSEDAGQHTLDALGLNSTFRWTSVRDMPDRMFAVRGSKILQHAHGSHLRRLAEIIADATDPARPKTQSQIRKQIREEWPRATASQVARIARTESANVWENTNYNVARANGVQEFDWIVAHGPSIGPPKSYPVCPLCIERATSGPYLASDPNWSIPPRHPNCRCTMVPKLEGDWLPPATTWSGGPNPPLPLVGRKAEWEP